MGEWDNPTLETVLEHEEEQSERGKRTQRSASTIFLDPEGMPLEKLKRHLCELAWRRGMRGLPRVNACRSCVSQCAYGKRAIVLVGEAMKKGRQKKMDEAQKKDAEQEAKPADDGKIAVRLTKGQCEAAAEHIRNTLLDTIRGDPDIDNVDWLACMIDAMRALEEAKNEG